MTDTTYTAEAAPKYERAYRVMLQRLKAGLYPVGGRMPTEGELAEHFEVSRVTIRRALDMLVHDGYIESRQGSGYRVVTLSPASDTCLTSFTDAMLRAGREPTSRFLGMERLRPDDPTAAGLPQDLISMPLMRISRLRLVDGQPRMLVLTYAPFDLMKDATPADFPETGPGQSILRILGDRFNLEWSAACEDISPIAATADMASTLGVTEGTPLLKQSCSAFDDADKTVFHEEVIRNGSVSFNLSSQTRMPRHI